MGKCETCGKEVLLPFVCNNCGNQFCGEHRLPETHNCSYLKPKTGESYEIEHRKHKPERVIEERPPKTLQNRNIEHFQKNNQTGKWKIAVVVLFIGIVAVNVYFWNWKYTVDLQTSYDSGFNIGYNEGNQTGYDLGYNSGNQSGYTSGYNTGNVFGYQIGYNAGTSEGYDSGYDVGYFQGVEDGAGSGYVIRDPTFSEAKNFISIDQTDSNEYSETYTCHKYTADVKNNAFESGYRCGYVYVEFQEMSHAIVCFNTIDEGLIFIEPQDDSEVQVIVGQPYWDRVKYLQPSYDDTVVSFDIIW